MAASSPDSPQLSVVLPMFNEADVVAATVSEVTRQLERTGLAHELLCVDDGSEDETPRALESLQAQDRRIRPIRLARNFGKEAAMAAGLDLARGKAVLLLDADLQHPPDLIPAMVDAWRRGADVVNGVKRSRGREGLTYKLMAGTFNRLMGTAAGRSFQGSSDFKLLDRQVVEAVRRCPERHRFFRGLVAWVGFRVIDVPFEVQERAGGTSKWSTRGLIRYSIENLLSFTALPLRLIAVAGFSMLAFTGLLAGWTMYRYLRGDSVAGFPTVILLQLIFGSVLLTCLGVISLYLAEMFDELKRRPLYVYRVPDPERDHAVSRPPASSEFGSFGSVEALTTPDLRLPERHTDPEFSGPEPSTLSFRRQVALADEEAAVGSPRGPDAGRGRPGGEPTRPVAPPSDLADDDPTAKSVAPPPRRNEPGS